MKITWIVMTLAGLLLVSCGNSYHQPEPAELTVYNQSADELVAKKKLRDSLFLPERKGSPTRLVMLDSFEGDAALMEAFPETFELLKSEKAEYVHYYSDSCITIGLKIHEKSFRVFHECLILNGSNCCYAQDCNLPVEKQAILSGKWKYQVIRIEMDW